MLLSGYAFFSALMTPLPTTWFGRHANGWMQTMLGVPWVMSSTISPVRNHPSPYWFPRERNGFVISAT